MPSSCTRRRAFTVLEMTLVLTVAGVLLALAVPRLAAARDASSVRAATNELIGVFATARHTAITRRAPVAIVFDTAAGSVELRSAGNILLHRPLKAIYGIALASNRDSAVYDPRGLGYGVSNLSATVRRGGMIDTLTMSRLGRVRW
jgi:prepilin-type N-terminal cleavage/methylation domain-containing protein